MMEMSFTRKVLIALLLCVGEVELFESINFNGNLTGIDFYPYVQGNDLKETLGVYYFTIENLRTMMKVVSTKFSRVFVASVDAHDDVPYRKGVSYYYNANVRARSAEVAAEINRERKNLSLRVMIGFTDEDWTSYGNVSVAMQIALEAVEIAHSIYPGTVEGIFVSNYASSSLQWANKTLQNVKTLRNMSTIPGTKIGTQQSCKSILQTGSKKLLLLKKEILRISDFIICQSSPTNVKHGAILSFNAIRSGILRDREDMKLINSQIDVMWRTYWPKSENKTKDNIENLKNYWAAVASFAVEHNFPVWFRASFEDETKKYMTWWILPSQSHINNASAYVETVSGLQAVAKIESQKVGSQDSVEIMPYYKIFGGVCLLALGSILFAIIVKYVRKNMIFSRFTILTRREIDEFRLGIAEDDVVNNVYDENVVSVNALKRPYDRLLEIPKGNLEILQNQILGGGEFGCVFKAVVKAGVGIEKEVALKMIRPDAGVTAIKGLLSEIKILSYLGKHPHVVSIIGAYTAEVQNGTVYMATELCPLGSLKSCLKKCGDTIRQSKISTLPLNDMVRWSHEIACGMEYLEVMGVIHADLATRNVLLSSESVAKIADFGLSRRLYEYVNYTKTKQEPLPWRWMAVESLKMSEFSIKSDVWSYGVTLWEIFSIGCQPYPGLTWNADFIETLEDGYRMKKPRNATQEIFEIMTKCWSLDKNARPTFSELKLSTLQIQNMMVNELYTTLNECPPGKKRGE